MNTGSIIGHIDRIINENTFAHITSVQSDGDCSCRTDLNRINFPEVGKDSTMGFLILFMVTLLSPLHYIHTKSKVYLPVV